MERNKFMSVYNASVEAQLEMAARMAARRLGLEDLIPKNIGTIVPGNSLPQEFIPRDAFHKKGEKIAEFKSKILTCDENNDNTPFIKYIYMGLYYNKEFGEYYQMTDICKVSLEEDSPEEFDKEDPFLGKNGIERSRSDFDSKRKMCGILKEKVHYQLLEVHREQENKFKRIAAQKAEDRAKDAKEFSKMIKKNKTAIKKEKGYNSDNWSGMVL